MRTSKFAAFITIALLLLRVARLQAQQIAVPNGLFELPTTSIAYPFINSWEQMPPGADEETGVFTNDPDFGPGEYLVNGVGTQAAFLFSAPDDSIFQDYDSVDWLGESNTLSATFDVGKGYQLITGITGGAVEPLTPGTVLQMSLYYRDGSGNMITVGATNIAYDPAVFTPTNFVNCELDIPAVKNTDAWAGKHLGIQFHSLATYDNYGGTWDLNNVQLFSTPALVNPAWSNGQFSATLKSQPGTVFQILATSNLSLAISNWSSVVTLTNVSGTAAFTDPMTNCRARFYAAKQLMP